jgi:hypothetical protein
MEEVSLLPLTPLQKRFIGVGYIAVGTLVSAACAGLIARSNRSRLRVVVGNLGIIVLGSYLNVTAFAYIPQTEASALGGLETLWVRLISRFFYCERVSRREWMASGGVLVGCALVALASPPLVPPAPDAPGPRLTLLIGAYATLFILSSRPSPSSHLAPTLSAGVIGGFTDAMAKAFEFSQPTHLWGLAALTFSFAQITLLNVALAAGGETAVQPLYKSVLALSAILVGGAAFSEFSDVAAPAASLFAIGTALSLSSAAFLSQKRIGLTSFSPFKNDPRSPPPPRSL